MNPSPTPPADPTNDDEDTREGVNPGDPGPPILEVPTDDPRTQAPISKPPPAV